MSEKDDRLSAPPPGDDWIAPNTLAGDLTLTPEQYLERVSSIPAEPVIGDVSPDPLEPGPDGIIPGSTLHTVLTQIQTRLHELIDGQNSLTGKVDGVARELSHVKEIATHARANSALWVDEANRERAIAESISDRLNILEERLSCPQDQCLMKRVVGSAISGSGTTGVPGE